MATGQRRNYLAVGTIVNAVFGVGVGTVLYLSTGQVIFVIVSALAAGIGSCIGAGIGGGNRMAGSEEEREGGAATRLSPHG